MKRSALMLLAGLVAGLIIGLSFSHSHRDERNVSASAAVGSTVAVSSPHVRPSMSSSDQREIVLGDILTVPFQELYAVLSTLPPERLANLAGELRKLPPGSQTNNKIAAFFKAWAHFDPMSALQAAALFKTTEGKNFAVQGIIESADTAQIEALAKTIKDWPPDVVTREQRNSFLASALMKWAPLDPAAAAKFFDTTQVGSLQFNPTASIIAQNWAAMDSQAAMSWAQAHANGQNFNSALNGALTGWWQKDHAAAEGYAATHLSTLQDRQIASTLAANIYNSDPARAKDWVSHLSDAEARLSGHPHARDHNELQ